jgi:hypothetical protein
MHVIDMREAGLRQVNAQVPPIAPHHRNIYSPDANWKAGHKGD